MTNELILVKEELFQGVQCEVWRDKEQNFFMTREQIGSCLGYSDPIRAISKIHKRHEERLNKFSVVVKMTSTDGKEYLTTLYNKHGLYEICRRSNKQKADDFYDFVYSLLDALEQGKLVWQNQRNISLNQTKDLRKLISKHYPPEEVQIRCINYSQLLCYLTTGMRSVKSYKKSIGITDERSLADLLTEEKIIEYNQHLNKISVFLESGLSYKEIASVMTGKPITITLKSKELIN